MAVSYLKGIYIMKIIISILISILCFLISYCALEKEKADKFKTFKAKRPDEFQGKTFSVKQVYILSGLISIISFVVAMKIFHDVKDVLNIIKMIFLLVCITGAAAFDFRERRIPNIFPAVLSISAIVLLVIGFLTGQDGAMSYTISSVFGALGCAICLILANYLSKQGIGLGDIKLLCSIALVGGVNILCGTLFFSILPCCFVSIAMLVSKKKKINESIPFGPFIYIGMIITIFTSMF